MLKSLISLAALVGTGLAATVQYDWDIEWVTAAPDGFSRPVIGINGKWPLPPIEATVGDQVVVNLNNKLGNESTGLHFHGIHQIGTNNNDGPSGATQCPVPPGLNWTYSFTVDQAGTYWYHSHTGSQYPDGLRAPLIVKDTNDPYAGDYDEEYVVTLSDWYHDQDPVLISQILSPSNTEIIPPIPVVGLINEAANNVANTTLDFQPGKKYKIRLINMSALASVFFIIDGHTLNVIEVDGVDTQEAEAEQIYIAPAQRYSFIVEAKSDASQNYAFLAVFDPNPDFALPGSVFPLNTTGYLVYDSTKALPAAPVIDAWNPFDDTTLKTYSNTPILLAPDNIATVDFNFGFDSNGIPRAFINNQTYINQKVPTLYTALSVGEDATNPLVYGDVNPFVVENDQTVQIIVNNRHFAHHPFHLHGHQFQVLERAAPNTGDWNGDETSFPAIPMMRDSLIIWPNSSAVLRFSANNPGVWLFHCHLEWHVTLGLTATFIESPLELQKTLTIPQAQYEVCAAQCLPTAGNAGGNTQNHTDLSGANNVAPTTDNGALYTAPSTCSLSSTSSASHTTTGTGKATTTGTGKATTTGTGKATTTGTGKATTTGTGKGSTTSTVYTTHVYTVTSCASTVSNCPAGPHVTTETIALSTTVCPIEEASTTEPSGYEEHVPTSTSGPWTSAQVHTEECGTVYETAWVYYTSGTTTSTVTVCETEAPKIRRNYWV